MFLFSCCIKLHFIFPLDFSTLQVHSISSYGFLFGYPAISRVQFLALCNNYRSNELDVPAVPVSPPPDCLPVLSSIVTATIFYPDSVRYPFDLTSVIATGREITELENMKK
jgi:hypothetical protein